MSVKYGQDVLGTETIQRWFCHVHAGNFAVKKLPHNNRLVTQELIIVKDEQDQHISCCDIFKVLKVY